MPLSNYVNMSNIDFPDFAEAYKDFDEIITRDELLSVGLDPTLYLKDGIDEISINDIISAAKTDTSNQGNKFNKELFNTCKILDAYNNNKKSNELKTLEKNYQAN